MLADSYDKLKHKDLKDWILSEKLDGMRAFWSSSNKKFYTRTFKEIKFPEFFVKDFPDMDLDGELWCGRQKFESTGIIRHKTPNEEDWKQVKFMVFDVPGSKEIYSKRIEILNEIKETEYLNIIKTWVCENQEQLFNDLKEYEEKGSEGLMLRDPNSRYENKRSKYLLKVKTFSTDEAEIIGYEKGKGRLTGLVGALIVKKDDKTFKLGSGLNDELRKDPPKIGSIVSYRYNELTKSGIPRFGRFICIRNYE